MRFGFAIVAVLSLVSAGLGLRRKRNRRDAKDRENGQVQDRREECCSLIPYRDAKIVELEATDPPTLICTYITPFEAGGGRVVSAQKVTPSLFVLSLYCLVRV